VKATFIEPMLLLRTSKVPEGDQWTYEIKWDGYRAIAFKTGGKVSLRSRNDNDFALRYPGVTQALSGLPDDTVIDGEIVALDESGRPSFNVLQNYGTDQAHVFYYVFDVLVLKEKDLRAETLAVRRAALTKLMGKLQEPVRESAVLDASLADIIASVKAQSLEGVVAKRWESYYEPGQRSGSWQKMRINQGQEFVIGGYTVGGRTFDALVFGYYQGKKLLFAAKTRNGFTPLIRAELMRKFAGLEIDDCPFADLPEKKLGRWGQGLTAAKMKQCRWLKPVLVAQFEFVEWTSDNHLRHSKFVGLRTDKQARDVVREA
jgi:bifunctional non-homologous end joining protein LigD